MFRLMFRVIAPDVGVLSSKSRSRISNLVYLHARVKRDVRARQPSGSYIGKTGVGDL